MGRIAEPLSRTRRAARRRTMTGPQPIAVYPAHMPSCSHGGDDLREHPPPGSKASGRSPLRSVRIDGAGPSCTPAGRRPPSLALRPAPPLLVFAVSRGHDSAVQSAPFRDGLHAAHGTGSLRCRMRASAALPDLQRPDAGGPGRESLFVRPAHRCRVTEFDCATGLSTRRIKQPTSTFAELEKNAQWA